MITSLRTSRPGSPDHTERHHDLARVRSNDKVLETIVVPLDGSPGAEHAIPLAIAIARRSGAVVKLVRLFTPAKKWHIRAGTGAFQVVDSHLRNEARHYLDRIRRRVTARVRGVTVTTHFAEASTVMEAVGRFATSTNLTVMASRRRGWLSRLLFGSVAGDLLKAHKCSVIFVRGYDSPADLTGDPIPRHLAMGLDGRKSSERALEVAGALARLSDARMTLVHVNDPDEFDERFVHSSPEGYLRWTARPLLSTIPEVSTHVVRDATNPSSGLLSFAEEAEADLIAVTTKFSHSSSRRTAEKLIRRSGVPVLVVHE